MPSVHSRPVIESDGNNVALRRVLRVVKKLVNQVSSIIVEGSLVTEEILDALGSALIHLLSLVGYPLTYFMSMPEIFKAFTGKPLPTTLPLIFVLHIILLIYSTFVLCYMPAVGISLVSSQSIAFHIITGLAIISYYRGVTTDPGGIPPTNEWEKENTAKKQEGLRFCSREKKWKPDRTHYCSALGRNVLKMDHYCPWLANCVGYFNHKFFLLFILYATVASGWATISVAQLLAMSSAGLLAKTKALSAAQVFFLTEGLCISSLISLILTPFTGFHLWLVAKNKTTLEYCEKASPNISYDFGIWHNFSQVFGYNPLFWFVPVQSASGDGLRFDRKSIAVSRSDGSDDEDELRIRAQLEAQYGKSSDYPMADEENGTCCVRSWDENPHIFYSDSPLDSKEQSSWWSTLLSGCMQVNAFRERCEMGFTNIMSGRSSPDKSPILTPREPVVAAAPEAVASTSAITTIEVPEPTVPEPIIAPPS